MKKISLAIALMCTNSYGALITTNSDQILNSNSKCNSSEVYKKTIILLDQTVDDKEALISALKGIESKISTFYSGENKDYLLNHKFEYSRIDDSGEHSTDWSIQTSKIFGNHSKKLQEGLTELNLNIEKSISKIKEDKKSYNSSMLLEQIASYSKELDKCDNLIVVSDLLLVDKEGNNFEKGIFTSPMPLGNSNGKIYLLRIAKKGQPLKDIKKVEAWWNQSLNGGMAFSSSYSLKKAQVNIKSNQNEKRVVSSVDRIASVENPMEDQVSVENSSIKAKEIDKEDVEIPEEKNNETVDLNFESFPQQEVDSIKVAQNSPLFYKEFKKDNQTSVEAANEVEDDDEDGLYDDFSDLGIDTNHLLKNEERKVVKKEIVEPAPLPTKKEVDFKFIQLACDEFTGRLTNEAFPLCNIDKQEIRNSKIEVTLGQDGRINSYENTLSISLNKKSCLSGYVASKPVTNVGTDFTCRVLIQ